MNAVWALSKRNILVFYREKATIVFSMMASIIVLILYVLFLRDMMISSYPAYPGFDHLVDAWVLSGMIGIVPVTTCAGALQTIVTDRADGREMDILVTPMGPVKTAIGFMLSTFLIGLSMSLITLGLAVAYLSITGAPLSATGILLAILLTIPSAFSGSMIMYAISTFFKSASAFSGMFTVVSVVIGFIAGIYMPMGSMPAAMQTVAAFVPASHMCAMFRQSLAGDALDGAMKGVPTETVTQFRSDMGFDIHLGDFLFSDALGIIFVIGIGLVFLGIAAYSIKRN